MALTELQLPTKINFYGNLQSLADEAYRFIIKCECASDFIETVGTTDLDALGVAGGAVRTDLVDFKNFLIEIVTLFNGGTVTPAENPKDVINKIRHMLVV